MFEFLESFNLFDHCVSPLSVSHHLGGCVVDELMRVPAFNCPRANGDCLYVRSGGKSLVARDDDNNVGLFSIGAMTKDQPGLQVPGVYVHYEALFRDYIKAFGSSFYPDSWLASAKSVETDKVLIVPLDFVLDPEIVDPKCVKDLDS